MSEISQPFNVYPSLFSGELCSPKDTDINRNPNEGFSLFSGENSFPENTSIVPRNIRQPHERYVYDSTCGSKERFIEKISYLLDSKSESECIECQNTRRETLSKNDESCLYGDIHCVLHVKNFCSNCQVQEPNGYQYVGYIRGYGFCVDCAESNSKYRLRELSEHFHNTYCAKSYNSCNFRKDEYCPYFHSAVLYDKNGGNIFHSIENHCRDAILAREKK